MHASVKVQHVDLAYVQLVPASKHSKQMQSASWHQLRRCHTQPYATRRPSATHQPGGAAAVAHSHAEAVVSRPARGSRVAGEHNRRGCLLVGRFNGQHAAQHCDARTRGVLGSPRVWCACRTQARVSVCAGALVCAGAHVSALAASHEPRPTPCHPARCVVLTDTGAPWGLCLRSRWGASAPRSQTAHTPGGPVFGRGMAAAGAKSRVAHGC